MNNNRHIAKRYAKAFVNVQSDSAIIDLLTQEANAIVKAMESSPDILEFFISPINSREVKLKVIKTFTEKLKFSLLTFSLLELLVRKDRISIFPDIAQELETLFYDVHNRVKVKVTTAHEPSKSEIDQLTEKIEGFFKKDAVIERSIDNSLIGGFIIEGDGKFIDMSVASQIKKLISNVEHSGREQR